MKLVSSSLLSLAFCIGLVSAAHGQTVPACATSAATVGFLGPVGGIYNSNTEVRMGIRQVFSQGFQIYDFVAQNVVVSGFSITLNAPGLFVPSVTVPATFGSLGTLSAGTYSVVVTPIATNVTPNVVCPPFTVPLVVPQGAQNTPVPINNRLALALLALALGAAGFAARRNGVA